MLGDLNTIVASQEKLGGNRPSANQLSELKEVMKKCGLIGLGFNGPRYTWNNKRSGAANIKERIDRDVANTNWQNKFHKAQVYHLPYYNYDHRVIIVDLDPKSKFKPRPFRLDVVWTEDPRYEVVVEKSWSRQGINSISKNFLDNVTKIHVEYKKWNKHVFGNLFRQIDDAHEKLILSQNDFDYWPSENAKLKMTNCLIEYLRLLKIEEVYWRQKSRVSWIKDGDLNTKFFHTSIIVRRKRN